MGEPTVGDIGPDFSLPGTEGKTYSLAEFAGQPVVLAFYPNDFSPVCTMQLRAYSSAIDDFRSYGAVMLGLSPQDLESHSSFKERLGIAFPLLADTESEVAKLYGVIGPVGFYRRSVFVLDRMHVIVYRHVSRAGMTFRSSAELLQAVEMAIAAD